MKLSSKSDLELLQRLIESGLIEKSAITQFLEARKRAYEQQKKDLEGTVFLVDLEVQELQILALEGDELGHLEFKESHYRPIQWENWGSERLLLDPTGHYLRSLTLTEQNERLQYGLILTEQGIYAYTENFLKAPWLVQTRTELCSQVHKTGSLHMPYDLSISPDRNWLAIVHRGSGYLQLVSTQTYKTQFQVQIREAGSSASINLSFDPNGGRLCATDNHSSSLFCIDLVSGQLDKQTLKLGQLGNLSFSADGDFLFVLSLKPHEQLTCLETQAWQTTETITLKGSLYKNNSNHPCDLMTLSPDREHLVVLTYQNAPRPFTPLLTVINARTAKTISRTALKDVQSPVQLSFAQANPLLAFENSSLQELLIEARLVSAEQLRQLNPLHSPQNAPTLLEPQEFIPPQPSSTRPEPEPARPEPTQPEPPVSAEPAEPPAHEDTDAHSTETETPPTAPLISLPLFWDDFIVSILKERFETQHLFELETPSPALKTLYQEAPRFREQLEQAASISIRLEKLSQGRALETTLRRRDLWLAQARQAFIQTHAQPIPLKCPSCHQNLMASWDCQTCGFEIESPERAFQHHIASKPAYDGLANGHFLLPDPEHRRLLEVNLQREVIWELELPDELCHYPVACIHLPSQAFLVADARAHQILRIDRQGNVNWRFDTTLSEAHQLKTPVCVKYRQSVAVQSDGQKPAAQEQAAPEQRYLIVDQENHRVLEINVAHQILWSFGQQGEAGAGESHLNHPSDIEYTPQQTYLITDSGNQRILEVNADGEIEQIWTDQDYPWTRPVFARRLSNGDTLVLDDVQFEILYISARGLLETKIPYYKTGMPPEIKMSSPLSLQRLPNQDLLISSRRKALQILPVQKKLLWCLPLTKFNTPAPMPASEPTQDAPVASPKPVATPEPLSKTELSARLDAHKSAPPKSKPLSASERLEAFIARRPTPSHQESYEHSVVFKQAGAALLSQSFYMLDQRHNGVIRVNRKGRIMWSYGYDLGQKLAKPNFVQESDHALVITDTHHNRVIEISKFEKETLLELTGPADQPLAHPRSALKLPSGNYLIADQNNKRLLELSPHNQILWQYSDEDLLHSPYYAEALPDGQLLFVDAYLKRVVQMDRQGQVSWSYGAPLKKQKANQTTAQLFGPTYATRLPNGHTLIADTYHNRVLEVNLRGQIIWEYTGHARNGRVTPTYIQALPNGNRVVTFFNHSALVELKPDKSCVWSYTLGKDLFQSPVQGDEEVRVHHEKNKLKPFYNPIEKRQLNQAKQNGQKTIEVHLDLMDNIQMKSIRAQIIISHLEQFGMVFKTFPAPEELLADRYGSEIILACVLDVQTSLSTLKQTIESIAEVTAVKTQDLDLA